MNIGKPGSINSAFTVGKDTLPVQTVVKDLGVTLDCNLKYNKHIDNIVGRARQRAGLLFKCFQTRDAAILFELSRFIFDRFLSTLLIYGHQYRLAWLINWSQSRDDTQSEFLASKHSYTDRLSLLKLESLELRRLRADLIMSYKLRLYLVC